MGVSWTAGVTLLSGPLPTWLPHASLAQPDSSLHRQAPMGHFYFDLASSQLCAHLQ